MQLKIDMTLTAATATRFKETAKRLLALDLGDDGKLAATVLLRIAVAYEAEVLKTLDAQLEMAPDPTKEPLQIKDETPEAPENSVISPPPVPPPRPRGPLIPSHIPLAKRTST